MPPRPRHPKPDANQAEIIQHLRVLGFVVHDVSSLGGDCLDLFVGGWSHMTGFCWLQVEIKVPGATLTDGEAAYIEKQGHLPILVARSIQDILHWFA